MKRKMPYVGLALLLTALLAEGAARALGMVDFPVYEANNVIGYIPAANQAGLFLNKNDWQFNSLHMGARKFEPSEKPDWLLVGDSIVFGGNSYAGHERLGPSLEASLSGSISVWPISAGSWALRNELIWIRQHPEVLEKIDQVVFVLNSADFGKASAWSCELTHPRQRPLSALWYLANKYVHAVTPCGEVPSALLVPHGDLQTELAAYLEEHREKTLFVLYPDKQELHDLDRFEQAFATGRELLISTGARVLQVTGHPAWQTNLYRDGIHPTPEGNRVLASILAEMVSNETAPTTRMSGNKAQ
ncbi:hypothetical protein ACQ259_20435 [Stutzerimonas stutzeri]|uniref:hypothetical protein n=1 Tax=Stutzerimonas stutzeri TaxID=316 RepID=UPI003D3164FA